MDVDRSDPGVRADARLRDALSRGDLRRVFGAYGLSLAGVAGVVLAEPLTGDPGATIGAIVGAVACVALSIAVWPFEMTEEERAHRQLEAIWRELRADADTEVAWPRYAAWATPREGLIELSIVERAPAERRVAGAPSPFSIELVEALDSDNMIAATAAMEALRERTAEMELEAEQRHGASVAAAERRAQLDEIAAIDSATAADIRARTEQIELEAAEQEARERRAQAEALASALRRG